MEKGLYYLAIPYHGTEDQKVYRAEFSLNTTAEFLRQGIHLFAPILYVNKIVEKLALPSLEKRRELVMPYLFNFLKTSKGLVLITLEGWKESWGVQQELQFCQTHTIPVYRLTPEQVNSDLTEHLSLPLDQGKINQLLRCA